MSQVTKYYCDNIKCKNEYPREELVHIAITIDMNNKVYDYNQSQRYVAKDICPKCAEKFGLTKRVIKNDYIINEVIPTTQQEVYDVIVKIMQENMMPYQPQ